MHIGVAVIVGDDRAEEAPFASQHILEQGGGCTAPYIADAVEGAHQRRAGARLLVDGLAVIEVLERRGGLLDKDLVGTRIDLAQGLLIAPDDEAVGNTVAVHIVEDKVLGIAGQAEVGRALDRGGAHPAADQRILGVVLKAAAAEGRAVNVAAGGVPAVHVGEQRLVADTAAEFLGELHVPGGRRQRGGAVEVAAGAKAQTAVLLEPGRAVGGAGGGQVDRLDGGRALVAGIDQLAHGFRAHLVEQHIPARIVVGRAAQGDCRPDRIGAGRGRLFVGDIVIRGIGAESRDRGVGGREVLRCRRGREGGGEILAGEERALAARGLGIGHKLGVQIVKTVHGGLHGQRVPGFGREVARLALLGVDLALAGIALAVDDLLCDVVDILAVLAVGLVRVLVDGDAVVALVEDIAALGQEIIRGHVLDREGERVVGGLAGLQQLGLGKGGEHRVGFLHTADRVGRVEIELDHVLAGHVTAVLHGDGDDNAALVGLGILDALLERGVAQAVAEGIGNRVLVGLAALALDGEAAAVGRDSLVVAIAEVDALLVLDDIAVAQGVRLGDVQILYG